MCFERIGSNAVLVDVGCPGKAELRELQGLQQGMSVRSDIVKIVGRGVRLYRACLPSFTDRSLRFQVCRITSKDQTQPCSLASSILSFLQEFVVQSFAAVSVLLVRKLESICSFGLVSFHPVRLHSQVCRSDTHNESISLTNFASATCRGVCRFAAPGPGPRASLLVCSRGNPAYQDS